MTMVPLGRPMNSPRLLKFPNHMHIWPRPVGGVLAAALFWVATHERTDTLIESESVGGRTHGSQCIRLVWRGGSAAYRNSGIVDVWRHAVCARPWHLKVLWRHGSDRKTVRSTATSC